MSASSKPPAPVTVSNWLSDAAARLAAVSISSARLDAQLILSEVVGRDRGWLLAHGDEVLKSEHRKYALELLFGREARQPLAYILGRKEFFGRDFKVTPDVLIPRPETEELIELALQRLQPGQRVIDVGTGSGAIAVTLAAELPTLQVEACDISTAALDVAAENNRRHSDSRVTLFASDLLQSATGAFNMIIANLPYVAEGFEVSPEAKCEPSVSLYADDAGYALIEALLPQAIRFLQPGGYVLLESDPWQQDRICTSASKHGFKQQARSRFHLVLQAD